MNRLVAIVLILFTITSCKTTKKSVDTQASITSTTVTKNTDSLVIDNQVKELTEIITETVITRKEVITDTVANKTTVQPITITNRKIERFLVDVKKVNTLKSLSSKTLSDSTSLSSNLDKETEALDVVEDVTKGLTEGFFKGIFGDVVKWGLVIITLILAIILLTRKKE